MQTLENPQRSLRKLRRRARVNKAAQMQAQPPTQPEPARQQNVTEFTRRQPDDWPPNTWWP